MAISHFNPLDSVKAELGLKLKERLRAIVWLAIFVGCSTFWGVSLWWALHRF